ncbi:cobalamin B12-binding domain-containing protein [Methylobacterium sp. P31]
MDACGTDEASADALARVIEGEILPRLRLLRRPPGQARNATRQPTASEKERLHALLLAPGPVDLGTEVAALLGGDMALETVLLDLLVPAARHLGAIWEEDLCDFMAATEGLGRLQTLTHHMCVGLEEDARRAERSILLMPCPGETHLYGLSVVASFFRRAGWDATILNWTEPDAAHLLREGWFDAVGLSLACDVHLPVMRDTVSALRCASRNPALAVIVGGPWFARHEADARAVDADAYMADAQAAPSLVKALLDARE